MYFAVCICFFVCIIKFTSCLNQYEFLSDPSEILLSFAVHRHGDRTPDPDEIILAEDPELIKKMSYPDGVTGLTLEGKRRAFQLGKFLRQRYGNVKEDRKLLSDLYLDDEIAVRSTSLPRTKMTILTALSALYPPATEQQWSHGIGQIWQPVPYDAVPSPSDYLRFTANCDRYKTLLSEHSNISSTTEFVAYEDLAAVLLNKTGYNFTERPLLYASLHDLYRSEGAIGIPLPEWSVPLQPRINEAAKLAYDLYMKDDEMKRLATGVVLNDFLSAAKSIIAGEAVSHRVRIYTAHDYNVGALMAVARVPLKNIPDYCSLFALELHRNKKSGLYYVQPVYLSKAGEAEAVSPEIDGCPNFCSFDKFHEFTKKYVLTEEDYFRQCKK